MRETVKYLSITLDELLDFRTYFVHLSPSVEDVVTMYMFRSLPNISGTESLLSRLHKCNSINASVRCTDLASLRKKEKSKNLKQNAETDYYQVNTGE